MLFFFKEEKIIMKINKLFLSALLLGICENVSAAQPATLRRAPRIMTLPEIQNIVRENKRLQEKNKCFEVLKIAYSETKRESVKATRELAGTKRELIKAKKWNDDIKVGIAAGVFVGFFLYLNR
jgi:hypothetical protein